MNHTEQSSGMEFQNLFQALIFCQFRDMGRSHSIGVGGSGINGKFISKIWQPYVSLVVCWEVGPSLIKHHTIFTRT